MTRRTGTPSRDLNWDGIIRSVRTTRPRRLRGRLGRGLVYPLLALALLGILAAAVFAYAQLKLKANSQEIAALATEKPREPMNVLVLGSDSRAVLPEEEREKFDPTGQDRETGRRADTIILAHLDERREKAVVVSFPRDLRVTYPNGSRGKINGVYQQGPDAIVRTVQSFTGLPIHHFVEANFVGFRKIVDALGGVEIFFERPIREPDSGLDVPKGCVRLRGDQALAFVRLRKIDDDFGRIARQQLFLRLMMDKLASGGTILNPIRVVRLVNLFSNNVTTDADLSLTDMKSLALRLRSFDPARVDMRVVPSSGARIGGVSYVIANERQTKALFAALAERKPLPDYGRTGVSPIDPADVRVTVLNGAGEAGLAAKGAEELRTKGYEVVATGNADRSDYAETTVFFSEGSDEKAGLVAAVYGAATKRLPSTIGAIGAEVVVVLGEDYAQGRAVPGPAPADRPRPLVHACTGGTKR